MESRAELGLETRSPAFIEVFRDKVYTYRASITEFSGTGLRLEMAEELTAGEDIRLLVNNQHLFARVRRCIPSESGFTIGAERIDDWNGPRAEKPLAPAKTAIPSQKNILEPPALKNPPDNLRASALTAQSADPRPTTTQTKNRAAAVAAGCIAIAGWAAFGMSTSIHGNPQVATLARASAVQQLPVVPQSAPTNFVVTEATNPPVVVPPLRKARVEEPPVQKAEVVAPPNLAVQPAIVPASSISIKATDASWVTACADGTKVFSRLLTKGDAGEVTFSRQATIRFGNPGAIELAVGNQLAGKLAQPGGVRAIKVTPTSYEPIVLPAKIDCSLY
jgi:hypothetical protein